MAEAARQAAANAGELERMRGEAPRRQARFAADIQTVLARRLSVEVSSPGTLSIGDLKGLASAHEMAAGTERRALNLDRGEIGTDSLPQPSIRETLLGEPVVAKEAGGSGGGDLECSMATSRDDVGSAEGESESSRDLSD